MATIHVAQWADSNGQWRESAGIGRDDENQQSYWAEKSGNAEAMADWSSLEGAREFAKVLQGPYVGRVRIVRRTDEVVE